MAIDYSRLVNFGELKATVETMKVYIDSEDTISIKGHKQINNTHYFYSTPSPTDDSVPLFSFDIAEEMFLDQAKTKFVSNFVWSAETYVGSTNPDLDGKPVMVLAVKGDESVTYSFLNLEELVDTYTTKDTASLSLAISEGGEISGDVKISEEEGNAVELKDDGLYVATGGGEEPLIVEMRFDVGTPNCTITSLSETYQTIYEALRTNKEVVVKGYNNSARTDAPLWFYPIGYIANSNMATFQCIYNYSVNNITAYYLQISSTSNYLSYNQYDMTKPEVPEIPYGDDGQFISFDEEGNLIAVDAPSGGSEPFLVTFYFSSTSMSLVKNANKTYAEISTALDEDKAVILKGIDTSQNSQQFYYFNVSKYDKSTSQIIFTRVYHTYGSKPEIWYYLLGAGHMIGKFTIDLSNYALTEDLEDYQEKLVGEEGQFVSFDEEGNLVAVEAPTGTNTSFVITCDLATDTEEMDISNVSESFADIYQACIDGKNIELKAYVDDTKTSYYSLIPSTILEEQIMFSMYQPNNENSNIGLSVIITSENTYSVIFNEMSLEDYVKKEDGKGLSTNDLTDDLLDIIKSDHTYAGVLITSETNMNNIITKGRYSIDNSDGSKTNCPSSVTRFDLYVTTFTRYIVQIAIGVYASTTSTTTVPTPTVWVRAKDTITGSWSVWSEPSSAYATNANTANKLAVSRGIYIDLGSSTTAQFDGSENVNPGVYGTLPLGKGGTGANNAKGAQYNLLNNMNEVTTDVSDTSEFVGAYISDASTTNGIVYKRPASSLWNYIKSKISSVLGLTETEYQGNAKSATLASTATIASSATTAESATKLANQCGILVNLGSFTTGYLDGTAPVEPGIQGTLPISAGGTGASTVANAREALGVAIKNHASVATTFGKATTTSYGHVRISDDSLTTPNSSYGASAAYAASLYSAQKLYARILNLEADVFGYTLVGTVTFGITMESNSISTVCTITNDGGTLPFTKGGGGQNTTAYFKPSQSITYACKFKRKHAYYTPSLRYNTSIPTATSVTPTGTQFLTTAAMALPSGELADVEYEEVTFSTSNYYYAYHSGGSGSGVSYADRGGVLYCYSATS